MYARNVTVTDLVDVAENCNFLIDTEKVGNRIKFTLRNRHSNGKYAVVSRNLWGNDRVYRTKVCFHGHYLFIDELLALCPDAIVEASWYKSVKYSKDNWPTLADEVGDVVVRQFDQLRVRDKCNCEE